MADSPNLFVLLESAAGYALFDVVAFDEIAGLLEGSMDSVTDLKRFGRAIKLKSFYPFEDAQDSLENANAISEHAMHKSLYTFLELNLPHLQQQRNNKKNGTDSSKKKKTSGATVPSFVLGVVDPGLATAISDGFQGGISCRSDDTVKEILRGCRLHLETFVKGLEGGAAEKAQLGLGHSYSRSKVKFNPARSDNMIIQSIALLDQLDKDLNTFAMRVREWYSWHFPELKSIVKDNYMFARCAAFVQDKASLVSGDDMESKLQGLKEIIGDDDAAAAVVQAAKTSMGVDCSSIDMLNIVNFTQRMVKLAEYRKKLAIYLMDKMAIVAPNLSALIGDTVAARLISKVCLNLLCLLFPLSHISIISTTFSCVVLLFWKQ
jgi:nucleolar protein 56